MNDQDKIAELTAEIARLNETIAWYQGQAGQRIGEAARAEIEGAPVQGVGEVPRLIELLNAIKPNFGDVGSRDVEVRAQRERIEEAIAILSAAPAAPAEQAEPSLRAALERITRWHGEFPEVTCSDGTVTSYGVAYGSNGQRDYMRQVASDALTAAPAAPLPELTGPSLTDEQIIEMHDSMFSRCFFDRDEQMSKVCKFTRAAIAAASPSPAPAQQQEPSLSFVAVDAYDANDGVDGQHPSYGRGIFFTLNCMKTLYESVETAAQGASIGDKQ